MSAASEGGGRAVYASAPGKVILAGEHAAVHGHPALVAALAPGVEVRLRAVADNGEDADAGLGLELVLEAGRRRIDARLGAAQAVALADRAARAWKAFAAGDGPFVPLRRLVDGHPEAVAFAVVALVESWRRWSTATPGGDSGAAAAVRETWPLPALDLQVTSALPLGAGCGSSAAVAAAIGLAVREHLGGIGRAGSPVDGSGAARGGDDLRQLEDLVHRVERRQHGRPSGIDGATVLRGGVLFARRLEDSGDAGGGGSEGPARWRFESLEDPGGLLRHLRIVSSGGRPEPTGEVVAAVQRRLEEATGGQATRSALRRIGETTEEMRAALRTGDGGRWGEGIVRCQEALVEIGVVPDEVRRRVDELKRAGLPAKISGAGSLRGPGAGLVLIYDPKVEADRLIEEAGFVELASDLGCAGVHSLAAEPGDAP